MLDFGFSNVVISPMDYKLLLHIGGKERSPGWTVLDITPGEHVDIVGDCRNLSMLRDESCDVVYASHVIEHLGHSDELAVALAEFHRVLTAGGRVMLSVPDLDVLCRLFLATGGNLSAQHEIMRTMFGGQSNCCDVHKVGLNGPILAHYLKSAGFVNVRSVAGFSFFNDSSKAVIEGEHISVNMIAEKRALHLTP